jgi:hypothetical protein
VHFVPHHGLGRAFWLGHLEPHRSSQIQERAM